MKPATLNQVAKIIKMIVDKETSDEQLQWMVESGAFPDLLDANPEGFVRDAHRKFHGLKPLNFPLIIFGHRVMIVPSTATPFIARNHFVVNTKQDAPVKIFHLEDKFITWFLGKEEPPFGGSTLRCGKLSRSSTDSQIVEELGGEAKAETSLAELFSAMKAQKNDKSGLLLTNGAGNIFHIKDISDVLRAVVVYYANRGCDVRAYSINNQVEWNYIHKVFYRLPRFRSGKTGSV